MARRLNVRAILRRHGLRPKSGWGQNFLVDLEAIGRIVEAAEVEGRSVVEVGAGLGALTAALSGKAKKVFAVERDRDMAAILRVEFAQDQVVRVVEDNAATVDFESMHDRAGEKPVVVGNLPYHMATQILFHLLESATWLSHWVLMFQKEMAMRMSAGPGSKSYGVLSVMLQRRARIATVLQVPAASFHPVPRVDSTVLRFDPYQRVSVPVKDEQLFTRIVRGAFGQRRKMVANSLQAALKPEVSIEYVKAALEKAGIDPALRPEQIAIESFAALADALFELL
jgi:16S rRNA (adenine1518-N6/adenine1519-N6)-dimethyltransferase